MEMISIEGKTNFFEKRVGEYALANKTKSTEIFELTEDFFYYFELYVKYCLLLVNIS